MAAYGNAGGYVNFELSLEVSSIIFNNLNFSFFWNQ